MAYGHENENGGFDYFSIHFNPKILKSRNIIGILLHEMIHIWQFHTGNYNAKDYHDRYFDEKRHELMKKINIHIPK